MSEKHNKSKMKGIAQLIFSLALVWVATFYALPAITSSSPAIQELADYIDESGIETGNFYYTSVEIVSHADMNTRSTIEFFAHRRSRISQESWRNQTEIK